MVEYEPGDDRKQNVRSKQWTDPGETAKIEERKRIGLQPSATGRNAFKQEFSKANLKRHFKKYGASDYPEITAAEYNAYALRPIQSETTEDVLGYRTEAGAAVRHKISTNDFVKGYPKQESQPCISRKEIRKKGKLNTPSVFHFLEIDCKMKCATLRG